MIRLHRMIPQTTTLGPGVRAAIWLQGCLRQCRGCMSPDSRAMNEGTMISVDELANRICSIEGIEGITKSGGEPFLQPKPLCRFLSILREKTSLGVIIYTGFTLEELRELRDPFIDRIITELSDMIIDGEYIDELNDGKALKGSANQKVNYITERYLPYQALYEEERRNAQVFVSDGEAFFVGIPDRNTFETWKKAVDLVNKKTVVFEDNEPGDLSGHERGIVYGNG